VLPLRSSTKDKKRKREQLKKKRREEGKLPTQPEADSSSRNSFEIWLKIKLLGIQTEWINQLYIILITFISFISFISFFMDFSTRWRKMLPPMVYASCFGFFLYRAIIYETKRARWQENKDQKIKDLQELKEKKTIRTAAKIEWNFRWSSRWRYYNFDKKRKVKARKNGSTVYTSTKHKPGSTKTKWKQRSTTTLNSSKQVKRTHSKLNNALSPSCRCPNALNPWILNK